MTEKIIRELIHKAREAARNSYSPYSHFRVGAALMAKGGEIITGTNVENRSYGATICAERSAVVAAVSQGFREFTALVIVGLDYHTFLPPCGMCRQVLSEFAPGLIIILADNQDNYREYTMADMLPEDSLFDLKNAGTADDR